MTAGLACTVCGTELRENAKFCDECGTARTSERRSAEYKQVTVLFADVVHSMDIAATVGSERLREIMSELVNRTAAVVRRYGGTLDKFTGDGVMAVFGAPVSLEDHAFRACLAALETQEEIRGLAADVRQRDKVEVLLRIGLNSGQVIAGDIGPESLGYTAVGEQVGMAQRMESAAPAGGVLLSESTARLVLNTAVLSKPEYVRIKGTDLPVCARRLLGVMPQRGDVGPHRSPLIGRDWELAAITAMLDRAAKGRGCVACLVGPPGIGKSRLVAEAAWAAARRGIPVHSTFCESHTSEVPFQVSTRLLRAVLGIEALDDERARLRVREQIPGADPADLVLLEDDLGIRDSATAVPDVAPDARRRRLTALVNAAALARPTPEVYVIEDAHWVDQFSESLLADFLAVVPQTRSLVLVTYRPEYHGALNGAPGAQTIALAALDANETRALVAELLGHDPTVAGLVALISDRVAGNPFFAEEIVRDLSDRGVITGRRGAYAALGNVSDVTVPATLQAAIAARIDRLSPEGKRTLSAAAVIGLRFDDDLLAALVASPAIPTLVQAELIDQIMFTPHAAYMFRHPLIRSVAYESQLKSDRAALHRRVAGVIEARGQESVDENAALIAEHLEAAGDGQAAYAWHMRAAAWSITRDITSALLSWERARQIADALPDEDDRRRAALQIGPLSVICANAFRARRGDSAARFPQLQQLCAVTGDRSSLAIGMAGLLNDTWNQGRSVEASQLADEHLRLLESLGDETLFVGLSFVDIMIKARIGEFVEALQWSEMVVEVSSGGLSEENLLWNAPFATVLSLRGFARACLGIEGWRQDFDDAVAMARHADAMSRACVVIHYFVSIPSGLQPADDAVLREFNDALHYCEQSGDDFALALARAVMGVALIYRDTASLDAGLDLLMQVRDMTHQGSYSAAELPMINVYIAYGSAKRGNRLGALPVLREAVDEIYDSGHLTYCPGATAALVETLLDHPTDDDLGKAEAAINRLATTPFSPGTALLDITLLQLWTLLARARGDAEYQELRERYRQMARSLDFRGHIAWAEAMGELNDAGPKGVAAEEVNADDRLS
ncbi:MAG TPA: adenylate/guanylate cyclase domain-containing protein [Mycobacterium sp.]|nr:adenylate/guanylate cyclase domain-containing protein [Mycobacterium sp.]HTX94420.1 adenylate/guanylate cyclase domain-containing protein [Mycobacterium sp.]